LSCFPEKLGSYGYFYHDSISPHLLLMAHARLGLTHATGAWYSKPNET